MYAPPDGDVMNSSVTALVDADVYAASEKNSTMHPKLQPANNSNRLGYCNHHCALQTTPISLFNTIVLRSVPRS